MENAILTYMDLNGIPTLVGHLWVHSKQSRQSVSFEYDRMWLKMPNRFPLDPALQLSEGAFHASIDKPLFGAIEDSAPDRWGRLLMRRAERKFATKEKRHPRTLTEIDFLLLVDDETRRGALRFKKELDSPFLTTYENNSIPPLLSLGKLLAASNRVLQDSDTDEDLRLILAPGSSLGGARPKASVRDKNEPHSYLEIADAIRQMSASPQNDLRALWRRMIFNILISNVDDHLRNHAFLYFDTTGWTLSPAYDLNPTPTDIKPRVLSTAIDLIDPSASIDLAFNVGDYFEVSHTEMKQIAKEAARSTSEWQITAKKLKIPKREIDRMASAFEHEDFEKAIR
jgi:serine/threonine-protein kinase HipA